MSRGQLIGPEADRLSFEALLQLVLDDYLINSRKSAGRVERAIRRLKEFFPFRLAVDVTPERINPYIRSRLETGAKPASIRYELSILKRAFTLAVRAGILGHRPYIASIEVRNTRIGFFERPDFEAVRSHLPDELRVLVTFAYLTGWRIPSEILPLQWRQVDFTAGIVRLEPGTTKNDEGRTFPFKIIPEPAELLHQQRVRTEALQRQTGTMIPYVFHRGGRPIEILNARASHDLLP